MPRTVTASFLPQAIRIAKDNQAYTYPQYVFWHGEQLTQYKWDASARYSSDASAPSALAAGNCGAPEPAYTCRTCGHVCFMAASRYRETNGRCESCKEEKCRSTANLPYISPGACSDHLVRLPDPQQLSLLRLPSLTFLLLVLEARPAMLKSLLSPVLLQRCARSAQSGAPLCPIGSTAMTAKAETMSAQAGVPYPHCTTARRG